MNTRFSQGVEYTYNLGQAFNSKKTNTWPRKPIDRKRKETKEKGGELGGYLTRSPLLDTMAARYGRICGGPVNGAVVTYSLASLAHTLRLGQRAQRQQLLPHERFRVCGELLLRALRTTNKRFLRTLGTGKTSFWSAILLEICQIFRPTLLKIENNDAFLPSPLVL